MFARVLGQGLRKGKERLSCPLFIPSTTIVSLQLDLQLRHFDAWSRRLVRMILGCVLYYKVSVVL